MNKYVIDGETAKLFDSKGNYTLIDTDDIERLIEICTWYKDSSNGYWIGYTYEHDGKFTRKIKHRLHCEVLGVLPDRLRPIDHKDRDKSNNTKNNLVICTKPSQNVQNNKRYGKTGFYGICRSSTNKNSWVAKLQPSNGETKRFCSTSMILSAIAYDVFCRDYGTFTETSNYSKGLLTDEIIKSFNLPNIMEITLEDLKEARKNLSRKNS